MRAWHCALAFCVLICCAGAVFAQCSADPAPIDDGTGITTELILYEVAPGQHIVLYNTTDSEIVLAGSLYQLCSPLTYSALSTLAPGTVVPARGFATVPWPPLFTDSSAGGEVLLFTDANFIDSTHIMDIVCWGTNPHSSRLGQAVAVGKWSGPCNGVLTNGAIRRRSGRTGTVRQSYLISATPTVVNCTPDCAPQLAPADDGTSVPADILFSEIRPGEFIELYNATASPIDLGSALHELCSPFAYLPISLLAPDTIIPAEGFALLPWPAGFTDTTEGGELQLYSDGLDFEDASRILDFVCWGTNPHDSRKLQAEGAGKWSGACAAALSNGSIHRLAGSDGTTAASYDVDAVASPNACPGSAASNTDRHEAPSLFLGDLRAAPNPFNPLTEIQFRLRESAFVTIRIYRPDGSIVDTIEAGMLRAGRRGVVWNAMDEAGRRMASGVYFFQVEADGDKVAGKMVLVE